MPILLWTFSNFFTFMLGSPFLLPQRANYGRGEFFQLPIWIRQRGLSAWGIQTGTFAAIFAHFVVNIFQLFRNFIGFSSLQLCFCSVPTYIIPLYSIPGVRKMLVSMLFRRISRFPRLQSDVWSNISTACKSVIDIFGWAFGRVLGLSNALSNASITSKFVENGGVKVPNNNHLLSQTVLYRCSPTSSGPTETSFWGTTSIRDAKCTFPIGTCREKVFCYRQKFIR